jgi:uncharacterized protein
MKKTGATFFVLLLFLPLGVEAAKIPVPLGYVSDYGNMISPPAEADLAAKLKNFEETDSTQLVILTVASLEGESLEDYSIRVAEAWKIGQKGKDNGILFLVSREDRKMRIEVGRGLEGKLTDLTAGRIIDLVVKPKFKAEDYDGGFTAGVSALIDATRGEFTADRRAPSGGQGPYVPFAGGMSPWLALLILMVFFVLFAAMARSQAHRDKLRGNDLRRRGARRGGTWGGYFPYPGGYSGEGWSIRGDKNSGSDSGGGFSGGGGGFGGGGASGSW